MIIETTDAGDVSPGTVTLDTLDTIDRLLRWADTMGGWDSLVWQEAAYAHTLSDPGQTDILRRLIEWDGRMGGFEAPIWDKARDLYSRFGDNDPAEDLPHAPRM